MSKSHFSIGTLLYRAIILITRANIKVASIVYCGHGKNGSQKAFAERRRSMEWMRISDKDMKKSP